MIEQTSEQIELTSKKRSGTPKTAHKARTKKAQVEREQNNVRSLRGHTGGNSRKHWEAHGCADMRAEREKSALAIATGKGLR